METSVARLGAAAAAPTRARGSANMTATGLISTFNIPHGLGAVPASVSVQAKNALSAAASFVSADATNITITFLSIPLSGALSFFWSAEL